MIKRRSFLGLTILAMIPSCGGSLGERGLSEFEIFYFGKDSPGFASLNSKEPGGKWCMI